MAKRSSHKETRGGAKQGFRTARDTGTMVSELLLRWVPLSQIRARCSAKAHHRLCGGWVVQDDLPTLDDARELLYNNLRQLPWEGLPLRGEPAIPTEFKDSSGG